MEPESIKLWREEFKTRIEDIETDASAQVIRALAPFCLFKNLKNLDLIMQEQIWKDEAKEQIEKFYKEREQKLAANKVIPSVRSEPF